MRKFIILALLLSPLAASAQTVLHAPPLWCEVGGQKVALSGLQSLTEVQRSIPSCTVTVYNAGSVNVASIFSDALATPTPKANPFSAASNGLITFYAAASCYDIVTSGGTGSDTFPTPITYFGVCFGGSGGGGGGGGGSGTVQSVGFSAPAGFTVSGSPVTGVGTLALSMPAGWTTQDLLVGDGANSVTRLPKGADQTCLTLVAGLVGWGAGPCVGIPAGTTNQMVKRTDGPNSVLGDSSLFDDGSNPVQAPNGLSVMSNGLPRVIVNANPATTVLNQLVERNASALAINATLSSQRALGVAGQNAGIASAALQVTSVGYGTCVFDGTTTINDYVIPSSTTAGLCHDAGATRPLNAEVMGTVTTVNSGAGTTATVDFFTGDTSQTTPSAIAPCGSSPGPMAYYTAASTLGCDILMLTDGAGNGTMASLTLGGASAGYLFFTASSQPSFPVANSAYVFAPTSIPTTYALKLPSALGTSGQALAITGVSSNVATLGWTSAAGCPEGTCLQNAPAANQTITGSHQLINLGVEQTGPAISTFDANIQGQAFDPGTGTVAISGQNKNASTTSGSSAGVQGLAQGFSALAFWGVASNTVATTTDFPNAGDFQAFLTCTGNCAGGPLGSAAAGLAAPATGTTTGLASGFRGQASNFGLGTVTIMSAFEARANTNTGGGTVTSNFGFNNAVAQTVGTTDAAFHSVDMGSGAGSYGILLDGVTHNDLGSGITKAGSFQSEVVAFASLPACAAGTEGLMRAVNDSTTIVWGATITGGSTGHVLAYCDATNWTVAGK